MDFIRPVLKETQPLNITFGITLQQIIDVVSWPQQIKDIFKNDRPRDDGTLRSV